MTGETDEKETTCEACGLLTGPGLWHHPQCPNRGPEQRQPQDPETHALAQCAAQLEPLDANAAKRVVHYLLARYDEELSRVMREAAQRFGTYHGGAFDPGEAPSEEILRMATLDGLGLGRTTLDPHIRKMKSDPRQGGDVVPMLPIARVTQPSFLHLRSEPVKPGATATIDAVTQLLMRAHRLSLEPGTENNFAVTSVRIGDQEALCFAPDWLAERAEPGRHLPPGGPDGQPDMALLPRTMNPGVIVRVTVVNLSPSETATFRATLFGETPAHGSALQ